MRIGSTILVVCVLATATAGQAAIVVPSESWAPETGVASVRGSYLIPFVVSNANAVSYGANTAFVVRPNWTYDLGPGCLGLADVGQGLSQASLQDMLAGTYDAGPLSIGDTIRMMSGNKDLSSIEERLNRSNFASPAWTEWYNALPARPLDSRIIVLPVIDESTLINGDLVAVVGFTAFFIEGWDQETHELSGRFVSAMSPDILAAVAVPEPSSMLVLLTSVGGLGVAWRRRR